MEEIQYLTINPGAAAGCRGRSGRQSIFDIKRRAGSRYALAFNCHLGRIVLTRGAWHIFARRPNGVLPQAFKEEQCTVLSLASICSISVPGDENRPYFVAMLPKQKQTFDHVSQMFAVTRASRERLNGHKSALLWFTGLPRSGKSTIANGVESALHHRCYRTYLLDGDNVRLGLNRDLGFSAADRAENIRRIGEISRLFVDAGVITLCAFISPFRFDRGRIRSLYDGDNFVEIYCDCPVEICERRDTKGLYAKARAGLLPNFTGVSSPYEPPEQPHLLLDTHRLTVNECVAQVVDYLKERSIISGQ